MVPLLLLAAEATHRLTVKLVESEMQVKLLTFEAKSGSASLSNVQLQVSRYLVRTLLL